MISPGRHMARALSAEIGQSSKGSDYVSVLFELTDTKDTIQAYLYLTEKTEARTVESLLACGWDGADIFELRGLGSKVVELVIENETWEGDTRPRVRWVNRPGGGRALDTSAKQALRERMRAVVASTATPGRGSGGGDEPPPF